MNKKLERTSLDKDTWGLRAGTLHYPKLTSWRNIAKEAKRE